VFDFAWPELVLFAVVALVAFGPNRLLSLWRKP
jgi:Sec-independent protein translocase protein TatA